MHILPNANEDGTQIPEGEIGDFDVVFNVKYPIKHLKRFIKLFIQKEEKDFIGIYKKIYQFNKRKNK